MYARIRLEGGGGLKSETKQDKSLASLSWDCEILTCILQKKIAIIFICYDLGLISLYFSKNSVVLLLVFSVSST